MGMKKEIHYLYENCRNEEEFKKSFYYQFFKLLEDKYTFVFDKSNPKYIFTSEYGTMHLKFPKAIRVQWTFENVPPNFFEFDYIIGPSKIKFGNRYFQFPIYAYSDYRYLISGINDRAQMTKEELSEKDLFCNFVYSNKNCSTKRVEWFDEISKYKFVHAPGALRHNTDPIPMGKDWTESFEIKTEYQRRFKFSMAFENVSAPGYTSEKIFNAFRARTIPIYWGDPDIEEIIDDKSFINLTHYNNSKEVIDLIEEIDRDDELYLKMVNTPPLKNVPLTNFAFIDRQIVEYLDSIFSDEIGKRNSDCKLWDYRYEMRYKYGAKMYEGYLKLYQKAYEVYKKIKH